MAYPTFPAQIPPKPSLPHGIRHVHRFFLGFLGQRPGQDDRLSEDEWSEGMLWLCRRQELRLAGDQLLQWTKEMERKPRKIARLGSCMYFLSARKIIRVSFQEGVALRSPVLSLRTNLEPPVSCQRPLVFRYHQFIQIPKIWARFVSCLGSPHVSHSKNTEASASHSNSFNIQRDRGLLS